MSSERFSGARIRQEFIDFFIARGHTFVPSSSLVPGGDQTLLFTNSGMVQFKDVFLGIDRRPYRRAANSQKCMRVAGKHNDLDDVGRDDTHHTFFEMLGNWSFGDYYKKEAIAWAWELLTEVWKLPKDRLWATCFRDDQGNIPEDTEAAENWKAQPGIDPSHVLFFGRKENFWEMAEVGPCGPCSEIHIDRGPEFCDKKDQPGHVCRVNGGCQRFLELWNLVFIQYNRLSPTELEPLPEKHVDTGMGLERIVSVLQNVSSNYRTDLFWPMMQCVQSLTGHSDQEREQNLTPYRVIADHSRAATFLIADGVVPGNIGRNYICRMIIRRAARFGSKIGLNEPFLAKVAEVVIDQYGAFYPELERNRKAICDSITREEIRFHKTLETGLTKLENLMERLREQGETHLAGDLAFDLYATYGLPLEITKDILTENQFTVDEAGFQRAMEEHRLASGAGEAFGELGGEDVDIYRQIFEQLTSQKKLSSAGVEHDPYSQLSVQGEILALVQDGQQTPVAQTGQRVEVILPHTCFYLESGGQVSDTGWIHSVNGYEWEIEVEDVRKPAAGIIVHIGKVTKGSPKVGDFAIAEVDSRRRQDIMRNHTATHLLHRHLRRVLGEHARQAGSLVAPDRLRFDFTHPEPLTPQQLQAIQDGVNQDILDDYPLHIEYKPLQKAIEDGAIALFGEKYGEIVRNVTIGADETLSNELCGGTHVEHTGQISLFLILSEGSAAAGIRRIEAVTGRRAYEVAAQRMNILSQVAASLSVSPENLVSKVQRVLEDLDTSHKQILTLKQQVIQQEFEKEWQKHQKRIGKLTYVSFHFADAEPQTLRQIVDYFRQKNPQKGLIVLSSEVNRRPQVLVGITDDLVKEGWNAIDLVRYLAEPLGGGGGGRPNLAQAGGKDSSKLSEAITRAEAWILNKLNGG
ncbi:MAG: alanine--tRNA ligase [Anaerolineae bacterium]|nr:MAG: alanine--tRNA ligase [Anaerolineae bacterium]